MNSKRKIRILVVDDSVIIRRLVSDVLNSDPKLEVVGIAANGKIAMTKIAALKPDIVILDVEMPEMGGLETLKAIRAISKKLPVIMFSALTERGAVTTLDALALGANDYVAKPQSGKSLADSQNSIRQTLIPKIIAVCSLSPPIRTKRKPLRKVALATSDQSEHERIDIVAIGVSTGGPNALADLIPRIPAGFPVPIVIVQHMPPVFTTSLAKRLSGLSALDVHEAADGDIIEAGGVWLAPGGYHMEIVRSRGRSVVRTNQRPQEHSCRPAVDPLLRSVCESYANHTLAVILTGMGKDGMLGCDAIIKSGGQVLVQDEQSSVVWGMPGAVVRAGLTESIIPLSKMAQEIGKRVERSRRNHTRRRPAPMRKQVTG